MTTAQLQFLAEGLARNRRTGVVTDLPMSLLTTADDALSVQSAALDLFDDDFRGYSLAATNPSGQRSLGLGSPIFAPIASRSFHDGLERIALPRGMLGAQCELALTIGETYPYSTDPIDRQSAAGVIVACQPAIGLLGRRSRPTGTSELMAIADFGLHVATIRSTSHRHIDPSKLDRLEVTARLNGNVVARSAAGTILGHPLEAVAWLARKLANDHRQLNADDVVLTGSCMPILQVLPGQTLSVEFGTLGAVSCRFE